MTRDKCHWKNIQRFPPRNNLQMKHSRRFTFFIHPVTRFTCYIYIALAPTWSIAHSQFSSTVLSGAWCSIWIHRRPICSLNFIRFFPLPRGGRPPRGKGKKRMKFRLAYLPQFLFGWSSLVVICDVLCYSPSFSSIHQDCFNICVNDP